MGWLKYFLPLGRFALLENPLPGPLITGAFRNIGKLGCSEAIRNPVCNKNSKTPKCTYTSAMLPPVVARNFNKLNKTTFFLRFLLNLIINFRPRRFKIK